MQPCVSSDEHGGDAGAGQAEDERDCRGLDPAEAGIALGFTQGIVAGIVVSLMVLALAAWRIQRTSCGSRWRS